MKKYLMLLLMTLTFCSLAAQNKVTVKGQVISATDNEPLIGVTVLEKGTTNGTITDIDGNYTLPNVIQGGSVAFSMLGFETQNIKVGNSTTINVVLKEDSKVLDDVVVIGYGTVKKSDLTSSITSVKGDELKSMTSGNALYSLQGKANGVQITGGGGPGATPRVIIRGVSTINGSDPLYVVDGVPIGTNINFLNQNDIESIEVLKDASAAAIYGTRGANGVIMVTTKRGSVGKTQFQFNSSFGFETLKKPNIANAATYEKVFKERYTNDEAIPIWKTTDFSGQTDWWDQVVNKYAYVQTYNLSFQGGTDKFTYSGSIGYFRQTSQYDVGYWDRLTGRFNSEYKFSEMIKAGIDFNPRFESWDDTPNLFGAAMKMDPTTPVYKAQEDWVSNSLNNYQRSYNNQEHNPVANLARQNKHSKEYGLIMNPYINITPLEGLVFRTQFGINARFKMVDEFTPEFYIDDLEQNALSKAKRDMNNYIDWNWTNTLSYMKTFDKKHNLNFMLGYTMERFAEYQLMGSRQDIPSNHPDLQYVHAGTINPESDGKDIYNSLVSYLGRVMYNYENRYYLTASIRRDGSSKFPEGNKYANFPAVSGAWRISEESFMKNQTIFSNLKLRLGWGRVGNQNIDPSAYLNLIGAGDYVYGPNGDRYVGTAISLVGNNKLKWETVEDYNLGIDASFLDNRLSITADVYSKQSKDMLMKRQNLLVLGYPMWNGEMWTNVGQMEARGWEFSVNWRDRISDFSYEVGVNLSGVKNKAKKLVDNTPLLRGGFNGDYIIKNEEGGEISRFYGYVADGIFQNMTEVNSHTNNNGDLLQPDAKPGDIRFKKLSNDGKKINESDKKYIGNAFPDLMVGLNIQLGYKNFDLVSNFYGTFGNDVYNSAKGGFYGGTYGQNVYADAYDKAWRGEGSSNYYPRLSLNDLNNNFKTVSSFFIEDGSYFRCKLLQLGYTLPKTMTKGIGIRFSASAQNLFTITNYSGMDPERAAIGESVLEAGIDNIAYPNPRTFLFGVNINF